MLVLGVDDLLREAAAGNVVKVTDILNSGVPVDSQDELNKRTSLHLAAANGHLALVQLLVTKGAEVDAMDEIGDTPLIAAIDNGHEDIIAFLKAKGANIDIVRAVGADRSNALYRAALKEDLGKVELLKRHGAKIDGDGVFIPLHAVADKSIDAMRTLLEAGANANIRNQYGAIPLADAIAYKRPEKAKLLLSCGASVSLLYRFHINEVLQYSLGFNDISLLLALLDAGLDVKRYSISTPDSANLLGHAVQLALVIDDIIRDRVINYPTLIATLIAAGAEIPKERCILEPRILPVVTEAASKADASSLAGVLDVASKAHRVNNRNLASFLCRVADAGWEGRKAAIVAWKAEHPPRPAM